MTGDYANRWYFVFHILFNSSGSRWYPSRLLPKLYQNEELCDVWKIALHRRVLKNSALTFQKLKWSVLVLILLTKSNVDFVKPSKCFPKNFTSKKIFVLVFLLSTKTLKFVKHEFLQDSFLITLIADVKKILVNVNHMWPICKLILWRHRSRQNRSTFIHGERVHSTLPRSCGMQRRSSNAFSKRFSASTAEEEDEDDWSEFNSLESLDEGELEEIQVRTV